MNGLAGGPLLVAGWGPALHHRTYLESTELVLRYEGDRYSD